MSILLNLLFLAVGMVLLIKGADFFVDGASNIAHAMKIPSLVIGLTLVSIGTSAPELSVSVTSALAGANDLCFGNVIGSNLFNTFVVIGASAFFVPLTVSYEMRKYDIPILSAIYLLLALMTFVVTPGVLGRIEAVILLLLFCGYMVYLILRAGRNKAAEEEASVKFRRWYVNLLFVICGLGMIVFGGDLVVEHAGALAKACGMSEMMVGLTIVAIGTSLPELVTSMIAAKKGEHDIAIGNAIGSNLFNITLILGSSAVILPMRIQLNAVIDYLAMLSSVAFIWLFARKSGKVNRWQGMILVTLYAVYMVYVVLRGMA